MEFVYFNFQYWLSKFLSQKLHYIRNYISDFTETNNKYVYTYRKNYKIWIHVRLAVNILQHGGANYTYTTF